MSYKSEGISVALPLRLDNIDGPYKLNKSLGQSIRQNFKNLVLTSPGERIMIPDFGVGLRRFLFEGLTPNTNQKVLTKLQEQVRRYMPFIVLNKVSFRDSKDDKTIPTNQVNIEIFYSVPSVNLRDTLIFTEEITS